MACDDNHCCRAPTVAGMRPRIVIMTQVVLKTRGKCRPGGALALSMKRGQVIVTRCASPRTASAVANAVELCSLRSDVTSDIIGPAVGTKRDGAVATMRAFTSGVNGRAKFMADGHVSVGCGCEMDAGIRSTRRYCTNRCRQQTYRERKRATALV